MMAWAEVKPDAGPAYYNEHEPFAADWLRNLMAGGHIAAGHVDTRSIVDVRPDDLRGYTQCHFFAGIGGWSAAARLAGWPDTRPVWTGSCPCQPFSAAGKQGGTADERHLWPEFLRLIAQCRPAVVFGEQVASRLGRDWLSGVRADLEELGYAVGAADLCAAGVGAPHIRQRLYWVADAQRDTGRSGRPADQSRESAGAQAAGPSDESGRRGMSGGVADADLQRRGETGRAGSGRGSGRSGSPSGLGDAGSTRLSERIGDGRVQREALEPFQGQTAVGRGDAGFWSDYSVVHCSDGKARRFEPGSFPLAHGVSGRVGRLRGYGNAIVPQVAAAFIGCFCDRRHL